MQPSVGRIVHYNSAFGLSAAIIIVVHSETEVDLQVFDGEVHHAQNVEQGERIGQWNWPPRV